MRLGLGLGCNLGLNNGHKKLANSYERSSPFSKESIQEWIQGSTQESINPPKYPMGGDRVGDVVVGGGFLGPHNR